MARSRNIKPGFFKNEMLAECSPLARLLFAGLWCLADRAGRLEDRPKRIRVEVMPYDAGNVDGMLDELHRAGFILRYQAGEQRLIQVQNFTKHQNPHCKEPASTIPAPGEHSACTVQKPDEHRTGPADSLNLIPDSLNPHADKTTCSPSASRSADNGFATFWQGYPKKIGKSAAEKAWSKLKPDLATVLYAMELAKASDQWRKDGGQYVPHPLTWLNQRRWEDEPDSGATLAAVVERPKAGDARKRHGVDEVFTAGAGWIPA